MNEDSKFGLGTFVLQLVRQVRVLTEKLIHSKHYSYQQEEKLIITLELLKEMKLKYEILVNNFDDLRVPCPHEYQCSVNKLNL